MKRVSIIRMVLARETRLRSWSNPEHVEVTYLHLARNFVQVQTCSWCLQGCAEYNMFGQRGILPNKARVKDVNIELRSELGFYLFSNHL